MSSYTCRILYTLIPVPLIPPVVLHVMTPDSGSRQDSSNMEGERLSIIHSICAGNAYTGNAYTGVSRYASLWIRCLYWIMPRENNVHLNSAGLSKRWMSWMSGAMWPSSKTDTMKDPMVLTGDKKSRKQRYRIKIGIRSLLLRFGLRACPEAEKVKGYRFRWIWRRPEWWGMMSILSSISFPLKAQRNPVCFAPKFPPHNDTSTVIMP